MAARESKARQGVASWDGRGSSGTTSLPPPSPACAGWCYRANFTRTRCAFDACWGCAECPCRSGCYAHAHADTPWSTKCGWEDGACWGCAGCRRNCTESVHKPSGAGTECNVRARLCQRVGVLYCTTLNIPPGRAEESEALRREGSTRDASRGRRAERDSQTVETERAGVRYGL